MMSAALAGASASATAQTVVYRGASVIDGAGALPKTGMAIVVEGDRIAAVLPDRRLSRSQLKGSRVVDLSGYYVLPGLIDSHEHLRPGALGEASLRRDLYSGVTAIRDMANDLRDLRPLVERVRSGELPGPDVYYASLVAGPKLFENRAVQSLSTGVKNGDAPWAQAIDGSTDLSTAIAKAKATGASAIKIYSDFQPPQVKAIAKEARRQGLLVWAHAAVFPTRPMDVVRSGVHAISHVCDIAYQVSDQPPQSVTHRFPVDAQRLSSGRDPEVAAVFQEMKRRGIVLDATNRTYIERERRPPGAPPANCSAELSATLTAQAYRQGVLISTGTDGFSPMSEPFPPLYDELEFMVDKVGIPPLQVIRSATYVGAMATGRQAEMGRIAPGLLANMMVVRANPAKDIRALRTVVLTIKRGRAYPRDEYRTSGGAR